MTKTLARSGEVEADELLARARDGRRSSGGGKAATASEIEDLQRLPVRVEGLPHALQQKECSPVELSSGVRGFGLRVGSVVYCREYLRTSVTRWREEDAARTGGAVGVAAT